MLLAAGCGGEEQQPSLPSDVAVTLVARSQAAAGRIEAGEFCAAREDATVLQSRTIAAINEGDVPADLQEELLSSVNALLESISCTPPNADEGAAEEAQALSDWLLENS